MSLYFNQYPYLYNLLSFNEVDDLFKKENLMNEVINLISLLGMDYNILFLEDLLDKMGEKIMKNKSIF